MDNSTTPNRSEQADAPNTGAGAGLKVEEILARVRAELDSEPPARRDPVAAGVKRSPRADAIVMPALPDPDAEPAPEAGRKSYKLDDFTGLDERNFMRAAYRVVLGREMDKTGEAHYLAGLRSGRLSMVNILGALRWSAEGRARGVQIDGLLPAYVLQRLRSIRVVGRVLAPFVELLMLSQTMRQMNQRIAAANLRHRDLVEHLVSTHSAMRRSLMKFDADIAQLDKDTSATRGLVDGGAKLEIAAARQEMLEQARALSRAIAEVGEAKPETAALSPAADAHALDSLYVAFENKFRGSTDEIAKRVRRYVPMFTGLAPVAAGEVVLDIGCGRGEWLSVLTEANVRTRGLDLNVAMVEEARQRGHDVVAGDAIAYLQQQPGESLAGVTGFHIVEHLSFSQLVALLDAAYAALKPGGAILFETPNPENLVVGACTFNYDPTHNKPLPPDLLRFLAEARGFEAGRIVRNENDCQLDRPETGFAPTEVNDWFRQPADYALFARKPDAAGQV
ncbi:hypothetical protein GCM10007989_30920 [Devosia pacifica]|uniref:DUF4214 domain-containing protein n=1 Tax=Devosia pacifica TaxID=1335967 RepID=A0A918SCZ8_9HYPH|nr:methyltransferase domain-containing protein [Devosia pacifica]GHA32619.1 hypothetical protein GCM10007989_30920 [Devosia pacifica]